MTTGQTHGELRTGGARDWTRFMEPHFQPLYEKVYERLGIETGTRLLDVGCGPGGAAVLAAKRGARVAGPDASPGSIEQVILEALQEFQVGAGGYRIQNRFRFVIAA